MTTVVGYIRTSIDRHDLNPEAQRDASDHHVHRLAGARATA
jgi:hypothetical protein